MRKANTGHCGITCSFSMSTLMEFTVLEMIASPSSLADRRELVKKHKKHAPRMGHGWRGNSSALTFAIFAAITIGDFDHELGIFGALLDWPRTCRDAPR